MSLKQAKEKFKEALEYDPKIATTKEDMTNHPGVTPEYLETIGLEKRHLKVLEKAGIAIRAYTKNIWTVGEELPGGKKVEVGSTYRGKGSKVVWLLLK